MVSLIPMKTKHIFICIMYLSLIYFMVFSFTATTISFSPIEENVPDRFEHYKNVTGTEQGEEQKVNLTSDTDEEGNFLFDLFWGILKGGLIGLNIADVATDGGITTAVATVTTPVFKATEILTSFLGWILGFLFFGNLIPLGIGFPTELIWLLTLMVLPAWLYLSAVVVNLIIAGAKTISDFIPG